MIKNRLKEILLKVKKKVFTGNLGNTLSTFKGTGLDFSEIKDYVIGDDVRAINWKSTAKGLGVKVNIFNEERELNVIIAYLISGSINFGTKRVKQDLMAEIMGYISYSALKNSDNLTTIFFDGNLEKIFKPTRKLGILEDTLGYALGLDSIGKSVDYDQFCTFINSSIKKKSLIFLIGDFYNDINISKISHKNEVYALIARDRFEENPSFKGDISLVDPTSLSEDNMSLDKSSLKEYRKLLSEHDDKLYKHFLTNRVKYGKIYTNDDVYLRISRILKA
ncbi:MAG: DUF58 domain-containing protein [Epsilonproteobacteria bacterium]|nr:DUF58 domain-containing protein [Campylobacterota bacterium]